MKSSLKAKVDWLILTALGLEFNAVREHLTDVERVTHPKGTQYEIGRIASCGISVALVECGAGNVGAAIEAERAIDFFGPSVAAFIGVAGGLKDVDLGDVVCATKVYAYESGKAVESFLPRPQTYQSAYALVQAARALARSNEWRKFVRLTSSEMQKWNVELRKCVPAPIAAGEKVIASVKAPEAEFLRKSYSDAVAVEMEGFGFLQAGYASNIACVVIRGISDLVQGKSEADKAGSQARAASAAAGFAVALIQFVQDSTSAQLAFDWSALESIAVQLYPLGPEDTHVWRRSGGDVSYIPGGLPGRAGWHTAITLLRNGGGGRDITSRSLLDTMVDDFPANLALAQLSRA
jgi:nucleoside phosphorylase